MYQLNHGLTDLHGTDTSSHKKLLPVYCLRNKEFKLTKIGPKSMCIYIYMKKNNRIH